MTIHDPDVALTDLGLALLGAYLAWRLLRLQPAEGGTRAGVTIMAALASAALFGAIFHGFFPGGTATRGGFIMWIPVSLSILVVAATLLTLALRVLLSGLSTGVRGALIGVYVAAFAGAVLFVDESYTTIVRFYAPSLVIFLIVAAAQGMRPGATGWRILAIALLVSIAAAVLQQRRVALDPVYFDHNALYHVVQAIGLVLLYLGFTRGGGSSPRSPLAASNSAG